MIKNGGGGGNRTPDLSLDRLDASNIEPAQNRANPTHFNTLPDSTDDDPEQKPCRSVHKDNESLRSEHVHSMHPLPDDLAQVVAAWDDLPEPVRAAIQTMVEQCTERRTK